MVSSAARTGYTEGIAGDARATHLSIRPVLHIHEQTATPKSLTPRIKRLPAHLLHCLERCAPHRPGRGGRAAAHLNMLAITR